MPGDGQYPPRQVTLPPKRVTQLARKPRKVGLDDFTFLAVLGKGTRGQVMLAEEKRTADLYAIKVVPKEFIIDNDEVER
jgi:novel protein kinase C epsilon type